MKFTINMCKQILDTLPVGYYCKRRIPVTLDDKAETSYYMPMEDKIVISYPIIAEGVKNLPDGADITQSVRNMLYHETSHAILTPNTVIRGTKVEREVSNIFEDERIETLLKDFYMNVDFKKQLYDITGGPNTSPTDMMQIWYNAVRFRVAPDKWLRKIEAIIEKYKNVNAGAIYDGHYLHWEIINLYEEMRKEYKVNPDTFTNYYSDIKINMDNSDKSEQGKDTEGETILTKEELENLIKETLGNPFDLNDEGREEIDKVNKALTVMFANFNKKNNGGNGINTYSGIFNPRAVTRKDYRYFERSITNNGNNRFGSLHLNLFLDRSGSFISNQNLTNAIIKILTDFERRNKNFTMDVYFINDRFYHCNSISERVMRCDGGNDIPDNINTIMAKAQKSGTYNYNIVLFDGDAFSDHHGGGRPDLFKAFDRKQTHIITDKENQKYMSKFTGAARVIVTNKYTEELIDNIIKAFKTMLS